MKVFTFPSNGHKINWNRSEANKGLHGANLFTQIIYCSIKIAGVAIQIQSKIHFEVAFGIKEMTFNLHVLKISKIKPVIFNFSAKKKETLRVIKDSVEE